MSVASGASQDVRLSLLADHVHQALLPILQNQPGDPLTYLFSYFSDQVEGGDHAANACRTLRLCAPHEPQFHSNAAAAFAVLSTSNGQDASSVHATIYLELMEMLMSTFQQALAQRLRQVFERAAAVPVDFSTFALSTQLCLLLERYCQRYAKDAPRSRQLVELEEPKHVLLQLLQKLTWLDDLAPMRGFGGVRIMPLFAPGASSQAHTGISRPSAYQLEAMQQQQLARLADDTMAAIIEAMATASIST